MLKEESEQPLVGSRRVFHFLEIPYELFLTHRPIEGRRRRRSKRWRWE